MKKSFSLTLLVLSSPILGTNYLDIDWFAPKTGLQS